MLWQFNSHNYSKTCQVLPWSNNSVHVLLFDDSTGLHLLMASSKENDMSDRNLRYDKPWNAAFDVTLTRLSDSALNLFYILAFLSPEAVPESMIFSVHNDSDLLFLSGQSKYVSCPYLPETH